MPYGNWKLLESRSSPDSGRTICVANQKGGVGKTTTSVNLAAALALSGHRTLVVDIDPQANATTGIGIDHRDISRSTYELLVHGVPLEEVVTATAIPDLECAGSSLDLAGAEVELVSVERREVRLRDALAAARDRYAFIFVDCPPSLGLLTLNALTAADDLIVPVQCEYYALEGLGQLLETAERVRAVLNPDLRVTGLVLTMYDARTKLSAQVAAEVKKHFGQLVYKTVIPRSVRLSEAPSFGEPVLTLDPTSRGSISHRLLAREVAGRYGLEISGSGEAKPTRPAESATASGTPSAEGGERTTGAADEVTAASEVVRASIGPGGRGYGTRSRVPPDLLGRWPAPAPWAAPS